MRTILVFLLLLKCFGIVVSFCVLDSKKGWWLDCGLRDSYLFRVKDLGGIQANFDFGFGIGDEKGFPNSISKTNQKAKGASNYLPPPHKYHRGYGPPKPGYRRTDNNGLQNRRSDFPYRYELPPKRIQHSQKANARTGYKYNQYQHQPQPKPQPQPQSQPRQYRSSQYHYAQYQQPPQNLRVQQTSDQQLQKKKWIPISKRMRAPPWQQNQDSRWHQSQSFLRQTQQPQTLQTRGYLQDTQRSSWQQRYPQQPEVTSRQRPPNRFRYLSPSNEFNQRFREPNSLQHYNPSIQLLPPPPPPPPLLPPPPPPPHRYYNQRHRQDDLFGTTRRFEKPFVFRIPPTTTPPPPTVGPAMSELLNVPSHTVANSDNVPSFAAKMFIVREAPQEFYPPNYGGNDIMNKPKLHVQIPRTKFFCEDQKYLPGIYADSMLGCKMFHLCVPSSIGSTLTSYLCPNGTLFDQSILQCNYWYNVDCESSTNDYDANLALALSYRRINAAHLPLHAATNANTLSLLSQNVNQLQVSNPKKKLSQRMGRFLDDEDVTIDSKSDSEIIFSRENKALKSKNESIFNLFKNETNANKSFSRDEEHSSLNVYGRPYLLNNALNKDVFDLRDKTLKDLIIQIQNQFKNKNNHKEETKLNSTVSLQNFEDQLQNQSYSSTRPTLINGLEHFSETNSYQPIKLNKSEVTPTN